MIIIMPIGIPKAGHHTFTHKHIKHMIRFLSVSSNGNRNTYARIIFYNWDLHLGHFVVQGFTGTHVQFSHNLK